MMAIEGAAEYVLDFGQGLREVSEVSRDVTKPPPFRKYLIRGHCVV
jgi:hypothetical protein